MRWVMFGFLAACSQGYGVDEVGQDQICVTAGEHEVCAEARATRAAGGGADRFSVGADVTVPGTDFGWEQTTASIEGELPEGAALPATLDAVVGFVPARVTCLLDEAHGDHCHLGVPYERACALEIGDLTRVTVDQLDDQGLALRFVGRSTDRIPDCCINTCEESVREPLTRPELPYEFAVAVRASWSEPESEE